MCTFDVISDNMKELRFDSNTSDFLRIMSYDGKSSICIVNFNKDIYCFDDNNRNIPEYPIKKLDIVTVILDSATKYLLFNISGTIHVLKPEEFNIIQKDFFKVYRTMV